MLKSLVGALEDRVRDLRRRAAERRFVPYVTKQTVVDEDLRIYIGDLEGREWYDPKAPTSDRWFEMCFMKERLVRPGDVVLECGAHHGITTMLLARWVGGAGKVIAFDPVAHNVDIIRKNLALNGIDNVVVEHKAVGARSGTVDIPSGSNVQVGRGKASATVELVPVDAYASHRPTLLKIDVEGFETEVLRGGGAVLSTRPKIALEVHTELLPDYGTSVAELLSLLDLARYDVWIQWRDDREPVPYGGEPIVERVHLFALPKTD